MDNRIAGMIGAAVFATLGSTQISAAAPNPEDVLQAKSFAELLQPIPSVTVVLAAAELASVTDYSPAAADRDMMAQYHHHHHHYWRHHHHHY